MGISVFPAPSAGKTVKGQVFTSSGSWTAPTGVNFVKVYAVGGGGGGGEGRSNSQVGGTANTGANGGSTTFGSTLLVSVGGTGSRGVNDTVYNYAGVDALANSGSGGSGAACGSNGIVGAQNGQNSVPKLGTVAVTPGTSYSIAIGSGGGGGADGGTDCVKGGDGGSGWLSLEWEE